MSLWRYKLEWRSAHTTVISFLMRCLFTFFAEDVDYIDQDGVETKGRAAIEKLLAENFKANPGVALSLNISRSDR